MTRSTNLTFALAMVVATGCGGASAKEGVHADVAVAVAKTRAAHPELFRRKIVLLGFDSCDPDLVDQYVGEGKLPNFARLRREGAHGALHSLQPTLSPVVWTTIATGMTPQRHGILDFVTETPAGMVPVTSRMRNADTIWDLLSRQGEKVGVVGWLVSWPAEPVNGFMVTDRMGQLAFHYGEERTEDAPQRTWPEELARQMKDDIVGPEDVPLEKVRPFLDIGAKEFESSFSKTFDPRNRVGNLRLVLATAGTFRNAGERLYAEEKPRFFACYFEAMDAISHLFMPYAPPKTPYVPTDLYLKYRSAIEANYIWHDRVLGHFMEQADDDTTVIVVSDHGFKNGDFRMADGSEFHEKTGAMWHRSYGVFYAWGSGIRHGVTVAGASVYDIAPTVLAAMGYPVPEDMNGKVLTSAFDEGLAFERVPTYRGEARLEEMARVKSEQGEQTAKSPEEEDAMKRLEALGYIGGDRSDPISTSLNLGMSHLSQGRPQLAYEEFKKVLEMQRSPRTLDAVAEACLRLGLLEEAEACIQESLEMDSSGFPPLMLRARAQLARRQFDEAEKSARAALERKSDIPGSWQTLALVLQAQRAEAEKAKDAALVAKLTAAIIETHEGTLKLEPRQLPVLVTLAEERLGGPSSPESVEKARDELDRALELAPEHVSALNNRGIALLALGRFAKDQGRADDRDRNMKTALESIEKAITVAAARYGEGYRGYARGWANKAYVLWQMKRFDDAAAAATEARRIQPAYILNRYFVEDMANAGHVFAPPAPAEPPPQPAPAEPAPTEPAPK